MTVAHTNRTNQCTLLSARERAWEVINRTIFLSSPEFNLESNTAIQFIKYEKLTLQSMHKWNITLSWQVDATKSWKTTGKRFNMKNTYLPGHERGRIPPYNETIHSKISTTILNATSCSNNTSSSEPTVQLDHIHLSSEYALVLITGYRTLR